jgi:phosphoglycerate dehydrogenase-like enzyme
VRGSSLGGLAPHEEWPVTVPVVWDIVETDAELLANLPSADILISGSFTPEMGSVAAPLKAIMVPAAGCEGIDAASVPPGCAVTNSYGHEIPIAEWVIMTVLVLDRELFKSDRTLRSGSWEMAVGRRAPFRELYGRTMGMVGFGHIGQRTATLATAFGMEVIAAGRSAAVPVGSDDLGVRYFSGRDGLERVLRESDFVAILTPLSDETRGLIGEVELALMKATGYIINPARGPIIDEEALYRSLKDRRIAGAALDTWYRYPNRREDRGDGHPASYPFWELDNVVMTPHNSAATFGTFERRVPVLAENIDRLGRGEPLLNIVEGLSRHAE